MPRRERIHPDDSERYMGRCFQCDRSVDDHDQTVCGWIPVPERGQWQLRNSEGGIEAAMVHVGHLPSLDPGRSSAIKWRQECPVGCSVLMQTSVDFERTWQAATNGQSVPRFMGLTQPAEIRSRVIMRGSGTSIRDFMVSVSYGEVHAGA